MSVCSDLRKSRKLTPLHLQLSETLRQNEVVPNPLRGTFSINTSPKSYECLDSVLSVVVVPRNPVVIKECEELSGITLEAAFVTDCNLGSIIMPRKSFIKTSSFMTTSLLTRFWVSHWFDQ